MQAYGKKVWLIPDCFLNSKSKNENISHEAICVLNTSSEDADIRFTLFFEDRDAIGGYGAACPAMRTHHIRLDMQRSADGTPIPRDVPYAMLVESNVPVVVQYSRLDSSAQELALMTTIAYPVGE